MGQRMHEPRNEANRCSVRALLADDHTLFRQALATLLASRGGVEVVGHVPNGDGLVALARREKPDVVFTELRTPVEQAKEALRELLSVSPAPRVVVSRREDPLLARELVRLGISAYVPKRASVEHLLEALQVAVSDGEGAMVVCSPRDQPLPVRGGEGTLRKGDGDLTVGGPRPFQPADSLVAVHRRYHHKAAPRQPLPKDGGPIKERGCEESPYRGLDGPSRLQRELGSV